MSPLTDGLRHDRRLLAYSAAAMYGGAAFAGIVESFIPGGPSFSLVPSLIAAVVVTAIATLGPRAPRRLLFGLGPLGVALIAAALATSPGAGDGAILYVWPALWMAFFFGRAGALAVVVSTGVAHAGTLVALPAGDGYADRWVDVMVSVTIVAAVVHVLARSNDELLARVSAEARTDKLTDLLNRRGFDEHAAHELAHARRDQAPIAVASFDIDHFKQVNDEWGHETGDRVLAHIGGVLATHSREIDVVARIGGEEFVVLLPGCDTTEAAAFATRIRKAVAAEVTDLPSIRVSAGVASAVAPDSVSDLLQSADSALYAAKRSGRNRTVIHAGGQNVPVVAVA